VILGETKLTYFNHNSNTSFDHDLDEATVFAAWDAIDGLNYLLADEYNRLYRLTLITQGPLHVNGFDLKILGEIPNASCLVHLGNNLVFVGSHQGDSKLMMFDDESVKPIDTIVHNIAPVLDFTIMDMGSRSGEGQANEYSSGQARIVTGSGAYQDGSLRSVRSGVGMIDLGIIDEMHGIRNVFNLRSSSCSSHDDTIAISFIDSTRVLHVDPDGEVEELDEFKGLNMDEPTLVVANVPGYQIVQVTASSARLIDAECGAVIAEWKAQEAVITAASANNDHVVLSVGGVKIVVLDIRSGLSTISEKVFGEDSQIACVTVPPSSPVCIVGFWQSGSISVLKLDTLQEAQTEHLRDEDSASVPRNIVLTNVLGNQSPTLFVAMADGTVVTFAVNTDDYTLSSKKTNVVGTQQANFQVLPRPNGLSSVFATCEHPSLVYGSQGRMVWSAVTANTAVCVCPFNAAAFPGSILVATPEELKISVIEHERKTHVRSLAMGETVRRISYSAKERAFCVGTIKRTLVNAEERVQSVIKLVDEVLFEPLDAFDLNENELVETVVRAELPDDIGEPSERFLVGTGYLTDEDTPKGRLMVFAVTAERKLVPVAELVLKGACRRLDVMNAKIVAALMKTIVVYALDYSMPGQLGLTKRATFRTSTCPIDLAVQGNMIAIADLMKSVSLVEFHPAVDGIADKLIEVARHYHTLWGTAVAHIEENSILESDAEGNLVVLRRTPDGVTDQDRKRLEITSELNIREMVNTIQPISIEVSSQATVVPKAFLATVSFYYYHRTNGYLL
jgi:DNA damage-binding protein 1